MARKKTVSIRSLIEKVNDKNRKSTCSAEVRAGWNNLLEAVLLDADCYSGFGYITESLPEGQAPGMVVNEDGSRSFPDESRRVYYTAPGL